MRWRAGDRVKAFPQAVLFLAAFFSTWFLLSRIDFLEILDVEEFSRENERKLGELVVETITDRSPELEADSVRDLTAEILSRLCEANGIPDTSLRLYLVANGDVNAFALPDRRLVVHSGLVAWCRTPEELAGVLGHEIAHIERGHVMRKLAREIGFAMLLTIAGGQSGGEVLRQTARTLSSTAFDRDQEREADTAGVRYMAAAGCDPEHLANFLFRLSQEKADIPKSLEWVSTHPNSADRAAEILKLRASFPVETRPIADSLRWAEYRRSVTRAAAER